MSDFRKKLTQYEVPPPDGAWDAIAAALDEPALSSLSERLLRFAPAPPPAAWDRIEAALPGKTEQAPVVPFFTRYRRPLKYSGAAAAFLVLAFLSSLLLSKKTESEIPAHTVQNHPPARPAPTPSQEEPSRELTATPPPAPEPETRVAAVREKRPSSVGRRSLASASTGLLEALLPQKASRSAALPQIPSDEAYMVYTDGDGNSVRLPKRMYAAFACPTDNAGCLQRLKKIREKVASSALTPNFTGLLEILNKLQENQ